MRQQTTEKSPSDSPASASRKAGITDTRHYTWPIFVFLVETGFHHVGQAGLKILTSWSACLSLPKCWDYKREPLCLAIDRDFLCCPGYSAVVPSQLTAASYSQAQAVLPPCPPTMPNLFVCVCVCVCVCRWGLAMLARLASNSRLQVILQSQPSKILALSPVWGTLVQSQLTATPTFLVQAILLPQPSEIIGVRHLTQLIFVFLVEMGFHHVGHTGLKLLTSVETRFHVSQAGLELLTSNDPPASASQNAGIAGVMGSNPNSLEFQATFYESSYTLEGNTKYNPLLRRLRQENHLNLGGRGYSELRSHHCTPAWMTEQDFISKKKELYF
ncbi:LOW QUALITY PROTEIN: Zinc finger protein [Plecturocebus cupreus]